MRKITLFLMLFCMFVGTAFAEVNSELISKKITIGAVSGCLLTMAGLFLSEKKVKK